MRKTNYVLPAILLSALILASPVAAHDGEGSGFISIFIGNRLLVLASAILSLLNVVLAFIISVKPYSNWRLGVIGLGSMTAFLHLGLGLRGDLLLLLNGFGYLALVYALLLSHPYLVAKRIWSLWLLLGYTGITFIGYFFIHGLGSSDLMGLFTKGLELGLIVFLIARMWQTKSASSKVTSPAVNMD